MNDPLDLALLALLILVAGFLLGYITYRLTHRRTPAMGTKPVRRKNSDGSGERDRALAISRLMSSLSATLNYQKVLETALDMSISAITDPDDPADRLVSAFFLFTPDESEPGQVHLQVGSARRFTPADARITLKAKHGLLAKALDSSEPQVGSEPDKDPELNRIVSLRNCQSMFCIPLHSGLETYGVLLFAHPEKNYFSSDRQEMLGIIARQVMIALQNARLYRDLETEKERMASIQEEARKKLARDLHDGPTQSVAAIAMRVNFARRLMARDQNAAAEELNKIEDLARRTTKEIRHMLFTLRPLVLESKGLVAALEALVEKMRETYGQNVALDANQRLIELFEPGKQAVIFYIAEEAVNNARKHAEAAHIWVRLKMLQADMAALEIEDDGVGFNVGAVDSTYDSRGSLGMINMRERAELVNGVLHIDSAEGKGTRIRVYIPLSDEAQDRLRARRLS